MLARKCSAVLTCPGTKETQCCVSRVKRKNTRVVFSLLKGKQAHEIYFSLGCCSAGRRVGVAGWHTAELVMEMVWVR